MMSRKLTRRHFLRLGVGTAAGAAILVACAPAATPAPAVAPTATAVTTPEAITPKSGGKLTFGYPQITSYSHFMHLREYAGGEWIYSKNFAASRLIGYRRGEGYIPDLADRWELTNDNKTLVFHLNPNVKWHDGEPFTAADVEFTWMMMSMPNLGPYNKGRGFDPYVVGMKEFIDGEADTISGLHVIDDHTVAFDLLEELNADVLLLPFKAVTLAPKHILLEYLDREKAAGILQSEWATTNKFVGTGPFKVVEYVPDQYIVYEPYEDYHRGKPLLGQLIYRSFADAQTMVAALESQEIDACQIPPTELERIQQLPFLYFRYNRDNPAVVGTPINTRQPYLADKRVRQALIYGMNRQEMIDVLTAGAGSLIHTRYTEPVRFGTSPNVKQYDYNPDLAKQLLDEAAADGVWNYDQVLRWSVQAIPANPALYDAINGYWGELGIKTEFDVLGADLTTKLSNPIWDFEFYVSGYPTGHPAVASSHIDGLSSDCNYVCTGYQDQHFHELIQMSRKPLPDEEMKPIIYELQELESELAIFITFYRSPDVYGINKRVHELKAGYTTMDYYDWEIHKTWVES